MTTRTSTWRVPIALVALGTIPVLAGSLRLVDLSTGSAVMPPNPHFSASPLPVVIHIVSAIVFAMLGAFQFSARFRRRHRTWHRRAGRIVMVAVLAVALSALWLNQFFPRAATAHHHLTQSYPRAETARDLPSPLPLRSALASLLTITLEFLAHSRHHFAAHRSWIN